MHTFSNTRSYAAKSIYANNLLKEAVVEVSLNSEWPEMSPLAGDVAMQRRIGIGAKKRKQVIARHDGAESDQGSGGRQVGAELVPFEAG